MRRVLLALSLLSLCGCPKAPPPKPVVEPVRIEPAEEVRQTIDAAIKAVEKGDGDAFEVLLTDDALVWGLGPSDTWTGSVVIGDRVRQALIPIGLAGDTIKFEESQIVIGLAEGERAAWAFNLPKVTTTHKGKSETWLPRMTMHLVLDGEKWKIDALHVSLGVPDSLVFAPDATKRLVAPADVTNDKSTDADQLTGVVRRALDDYGVKYDRTSERAEYVQLGTSTPEVFIGGKNFKELIKKAIPSIRKSYTWKVDGNLRVKLAPGGKSGWAAAVVVQRSGSGKKMQVYPAFRYLWTLVEEGGVWNISSEHQSLAVKEELRDPATPDVLPQWQAARDAAEKTLTSSRSGRSDVKKKSDEKKSDDKKPEEKKPEEKDIGAW